MDKKEKPLISIIVPVYNVEKYLKKCIDSILAQSYQNLEIILIDDGSTDSSGMICDEYGKQDTRIQVIHQENRGQGAARNIGLDIAGGDYIGFVDSDDYIFPEMYEILSANIFTYSADISACTRFRFREDKKLEERIRCGKRNGSGRIYEYTGYTAVKELLQEHKVFKNAVWEKIYKKELFQSIRFRNVYAEDMDVMYRLLYAANKVVFCDTGQYAYRIRKGSTVLSQWTAEKDSAFYTLSRRCIDFFRDEKSRELEAAAICWYVQWGIENYRRMGKPERKRLKNEMLKYCKAEYLIQTDYRMRKKIEFYIFARVPRFHCFCCNIIRGLRSIWKKEGKV